MIRQGDTGLCVCVSHKAVRTLTGIYGQSLEEWEKHLFSQMRWPVTLCVCVCARLCESPGLGTELMSVCVVVCLGAHSGLLLVVCSRAGGQIYPGRGAALRASGVSVWGWRVLSVTSLTHTHSNIMGAGGLSHH